MRRGDEMDFKAELSSLINRHSQENGSNTPDFLLAEYLNDCLKAFNSAVSARESWYGHKCSILDHAEQPTEAV